LPFLSALIPRSLRLWEVSRRSGRALLLRGAAAGEEEAAGREQKALQCNTANPSFLSRGFPRYVGPNSRPRTKAALATGRVRPGASAAGPYELGWGAAALRSAPKPTSAVRSVRDDFYPVHSVVCRFLDAERPARVGRTAAHRGLGGWGLGTNTILDLRFWIGFPAPFRLALAAHRLLVNVCCLLLAACCPLPPPTAHYRPPIADCPLPTADCPPPTAHCPLPTADCPLPTAYCPQPAAHRRLPTAHHLQPTAFCLRPLPTVLPQSLAPST
jgi:hypothetical protein